MHFQPQSCHVMVKPGGARCNLNCSYCFYLEKEQLYPQRGKADWCMDDKTLSLFIQQQIEAQDVPEVIFAWQGGEPTLAGLDFFRRAVKLAEHFCAGKKRIVHILQTNGLLLDDTWCRFLRQHEFLVGISIDGPAHLHDIFRTTRGGAPTHHRVVEAIKCLQKHQVEFNTLTVVHDKNVHHAADIYRYLKSIGSQNMQFTPLVERISLRKNDDKNENLLFSVPGDATAFSLMPGSVAAADYGKFLCDMFDIWVREDIGHIWVQMFEQTFAAWCQQPALMCHFSPRCGSAFALEANGDLYQCDHYVFPEYKLGNIHQFPIKTINTGRQNQGFATGKSRNLPVNCQRCTFRFACHGGCPKHRFIADDCGGHQLNYFCQGYKTFFRHVNPCLEVMRALWMRGHTTADIRQAMSHYFSD